MRVGLDAAVLKEEAYGIGNYIKNLIFNLASTKPHDDYFLVASRQGIPHFASLANRLSFGLCPNSPLPRVVWEQTVLPRILGTKKIDVFHGLASSVPLRGNCPRVATVHDLTAFTVPDRHTFARRNYLRWMIPEACKRADVIITVSEHTRDDLVKRLGVPYDKIVVIWLGVDPKFYPIGNTEQLAAVRQKYGISGNFILYVGVIEPRKNLCNLVRAFQDAVDVHREYVLVLAGSPGWGYESVLRGVMSSSIRDRIILTGYVDSRDLCALYSASSLFVYPSLYEGFGLPVLEAMACGIPVITSNVSSLPEIAGGACVLVDPRSPGDLMRAMRRVLAEEHVRKMLSEQGILRARAFSWERTARKTHEVYSRLLG